MVFKPHIVIEVGNRLLTPEARAQYDLFYLGENYIRPTHLFEFGDYIYYEYTYRVIPKTNNLIYGFIGSKTTDFRALINAEQGFINDLDGGPNILPKTIKDEKTVISWTDALQLKTLCCLRKLLKIQHPNTLKRKKSLKNWQTVLKRQIIQF